MARYIDADIIREKIEALYDHYLETKNFSADGACSECLELLDDTPTADVVPKSEVVKVLNEVELLIIITKETYKQQMEDATNELSKQSKRTKWVAFEKFYEQFAEFKKEYTEDG